MGAYPTRDPMKKVLIALIVMMALCTTSIGVATTTTSSTGIGSTADSLSAGEDIGPQAVCSDDICCVNTDNDPEFEECWRR